ncbi:hypothetical protein O181_025547, partial [Austropuccinia psidii MF-1]|nr:hypothetical protein [Austropuccinia psidii MF-1]
MTIQYSPPAKNTGSKTSQAILTPTARAPLYCTSLVHQLSGNLDRGPCMEGAAPSKRGGQLTQEASPMDNYRDPEFKNPSMKVHDSV